jgi:hypothetical protein
MRIRYQVALGVIILALGAWLILYLGALRRGRALKCPRCHSDRIRPSWPKPVDKVFERVSVIAYRCEACQKRFYAVAPSRKKTVVPQ